MNTSCIAYRLPEETRIHSFRCERIDRFESGDFMVRPFSSEPVFYRFIQSVRLKDFEFFPSVESESTGTKGDYLNRVADCLEAMQKGRFNKLVLSDTRFVQGRFEVGATFEAACLAYPNAFVALISDPQLGTWLSASPEVLLSNLSGAYETYSLAGTRWIENDDLTNWTNKEKEEQEWVSREIRSVLSSQGLTYSEHGPHTGRAGSLLHLKSTFRIKKASIDPLKTAETLHPTPAVAGIPTAESAAFLTNLESHNRELYTGYWGPINQAGKHALFVNLRTMKLLQTGVELFVGGGLTMDSDPDREWEETVQKSHTLSSVLKHLE